MTAAARYPCLSRLGCDRLLNGELPDELAARAHIASCRDCEARLAEHVGEREAFAVPLPQAPVARLRRPATPLASMTMTMTMIAALAAVVVGVFVLRPRPDAVTREKGRPTIGFYVAHGGAVRSGAAGEIVAPGDSIEFTASTERAGWLAIVSIDAAKKTSVYYPDALAAAPIAPGRDQVLPLSVILDEVVGREWIYGVFCDEPFGVDAAKSIAIDGAPLPAGCIVDSLNIEKSPIR